MGIWRQARKGCLNAVGAWRRTHVTDGTLKTPPNQRPYLPVRSASLRAASLRARPARGRVGARRGAVRGVARRRTPVSGQHGAGRGDRVPDRNGEDVLHLFRCASGSQVVRRWTLKRPFFATTRIFKALSPVSTAVLAHGPAAALAGRDGDLHGADSLVSCLFEIRPIRNQASASSCA